MSFLRRLAVCSAVVSTVFAEIFLDNVTEPVNGLFFTRPGALAPAMSITTSEPGQAPGLIFIGPYGVGYASSGPRIYDKQGNLVWDGYGIIPGNTHDIQVCQYQGAAHLCMTQCLNPAGYGVCQGLVLDSSYRVVNVVQTGQNAGPVDQHEFHLVGDGKTALVSFYQTVPYDLSGFSMPDGLGFILQSGFQEIDVESGDVLFEWYSLNHVDPSESKILPNTSDTSGTGTSGTSGFDYFHLNSVDKSPTTGDYLISARHTGTVYLINATDRSTIWQLSGVGKSDFAVDGFNFSYQHDARLISENDTTTVISIFDNAWNGYGDPATMASSSFSTGKVIAIDHTNNTARLLQTLHLWDNTTSLSQGNTQLLSNGNWFNGWGDLPEMTEHDAAGNTIFAASFSTGQGVVVNYRAFSFDGWYGMPSTVPSVYAYALNNTAPTTIYASWNGATEVATWRYYGGNMGEPFEMLGNTTKVGFETRWTAPSFYPYLMVEALQSDGTSLKNSSFTPTFTPSPALIGSCTDTGCAALPTAGYINVNISDYKGTS